jgi:hypothetical protein
MDAPPSFAALSLFTPRLLLPVDGLDQLNSRSSSVARCSRKNTGRFTEYLLTGYVGSRSVSSKTQGRNYIGLSMPHCLAQNRCSHIDPGRLRAACGEPGCVSMRETLLVNEPIGMKRYALRARDTLPLQGRQPWWAGLMPILGNQACGWHACPLFKAII